MQGTRIREEKSRMFSTLYRGRRRIVAKATWFLDNGAKKHVLVLTDASGDVVIKHWSWIEPASTN